jgi:hypothetical protein
MRTLIKIAKFSGDERYLKAIPPALAYLQKCERIDGKLARFYELRTNKPLFMNAKYELTYDHADAPSHYGWTRGADFGRIEREYVEALNKPTDADEPTRKLSHEKLRETARQIADQLDNSGRWVSVYHGERLVGQPKFPQGFRYLSSDVFSRNLTALSAYLEATK